ncbi:quinone oxidoreductase [Pusillimonas sp. ANT_WB101]|nr:quinone oxidoreductase [Pusillimonas sp. ANT_WB101]KAA0911910.1 quinone oxidoreductase [Pusillimonas sp. ANT_WB101]
MHVPAVLIRRHGGVEVLEYDSINVPDPGPGEVRVQQQAVGLNYADIYQREGAAGPHETKSFPIVLGSQGAGVVESIGENVYDIKVGDPVVYVHPGAYAAAKVLPAERVVPLPDGLSLETGAASLLRGMTAEYLLHRLFVVKRGDSILVHAAAGGMGQLLCSWARALGANVIGTVGSDSKREVALEHGCHHVINYRTQDFVSEVASITGKQGVAVVYDAVGRDVFLQSLDCLEPGGMAINFGTASGDVQAFDLQLLHAKSLSVCRPTLKTFISTPQALRKSAAKFSQAVRDGVVSVHVSHRYALSDVRAAHLALESRATTGSAILLP